MNDSGVPRPSSSTSRNYQGRSTQRKPIEERLGPKMKHKLVTPRSRSRSPIRIQMVHALTQWSMEDQKKARMLREPRKKEGADISVTMADELNHFTERILHLAACSILPDEEDASWNTFIREVYAPDNDKNNRTNNSLLWNYSPFLNTTYSYNHSARARVLIKKHLPNHKSHVFKNICRIRKYGTTY